MIDCDSTIEADGWDDILAPAGGAEALLDQVLSAVIALTPDWPILPEGTMLSVLYTDNEAVRALNRDWRDKDKPTNILSFPGLPEILPPLGADYPPLCLGDMALALETVVQEAKYRDIIAWHHVAHLLVHGILHLIGYDHEQDDEAEAMEQLEIVILASIGIDNPYRFDHEESVA